MEVERCCLDCKYVEFVEVKQLGVEREAACGWVFMYEPQPIAPWDKPKRLEVTPDGPVALGEVGRAINRFSANKPYINCPVWESDEAKPDFEIIMDIDDARREARELDKSVKRYKPDF